MGAKHRAATLYSVGSVLDPDHEAVIRFDGEAPRRRAHSADGIEAMELFGSPPLGSSLTASRESAIGRQSYAFAFLNHQTALRPPPATQPRRGFHRS